MSLTGRLALVLLLSACSPTLSEGGPVPHAGGDHFDLPPSPSAEAPALAGGRAEPAATATTSAAPLAAVAPAQAEDKALAAAARLLAGVGDEANKSEATRQHARAVSSSFEDFEEKTGKAMSGWAREHLLAAEGATVFYPFAGPDLVTAHRFYPAASRYVLVALQDGGAPPELAPLRDDELHRTLAIYERIFDAFARRGFFITAQMGAGYHTPRAARGITGVLLAFAVREGFSVVGAEPLRVRSDGADVEAHPGDRRQAETWASLRIYLRRADGTPVVVDYLKLDLGDPWLDQHPSDLTFLRRVARGPTLLKAASHLPQQAGFSRIRDLVLGGAPQVVQDETGLAYRLLLDSFEVKLYGRFKSVNGLFDGRPQRDLKEAYTQRKDVAPLPFSIGYRKAAGSALMVATRRPAPGASASPRGEP